MATCQPTKEGKRLIRAMAKARLEMGETDAREIIDGIHGAIAHFAPMDKGEIAAIVGGFEDVPRTLATKTELQERLTQLRRDLKATFKPDAQYMAKNATRQKAIRAEIARLDDQIKRGDFSKAPPKPKPVYSEETKALQGELAQARREHARVMRKLEHSSKSPIVRGLARMAAINRAMILFSLGVFEHLAGATLQRLITSPFEDMFGSVLRLNSKFREIDDLAPTEGGGFMGRGQIEGFTGNAEGTGGRGIFSKETVKMIKDKWQKGASDRQALMGKGHESNYPMLDKVGISHDIVKTPLEQHAYAKTFYRATKNMRRKLAREGLNPEQIDMAMSTPSMGATMDALATEGSLAAKLQGENWLTEAYQRFLSRLENKGVGGAAVATWLRTETPIVKIPANLIDEVESLFFGGPRAYMRYKHATRNGRKLEYGKDADFIVRNAKKQGVGALLGVIGYVFYEQMGGMWRRNKDQPNRDVDIGDVRLGKDGPTISHHWLHGPAASVMQMWAMVHYVQDEDRKRVAKEHGENSEVMNFFDGVLQAQMSALLDLPGMNISRSLDALGGGMKGVRRYFGDKISSAIIPAELRQRATKGMYFTGEGNDLDRDGKPVKRYPKSLKEELMLDIPVLRKDVSSRKPK